MTFYRQNLNLEFILHPVRPTTAFSFFKLHCHKLQEKIIMKLVIIYYTVTEQKPSVRMDTYIDFTDFFDSYIYFFHIIGKISRFRQSHPCQILRISSCHFPLNNLCKIIAHTKSSSYDQNTRKRLQGVQNINTHKLLVK